MDLDRPHQYRTTSTSSSSGGGGGSTAPAANELFICFTSRLSSSSSMKLTKSILSPGRAARDGPVSLSTSLSRRLRTNGSLKGGASPFFPTTGKKRGCGFENPEPSSPKVTCIGQVRVRTKKKVKQTRCLSKRRNGEVSFRKIEHGHSQNLAHVEDKSSFQSQHQRFSNGSAHYQSQECLPHRNQRWVHLPTICEALRSIGAEFSCLFPCKSSCFSTSDREKEEKRNESGGSENGHGQSSCGAVFARWLVALNDGEGEKRREIELVVGGGDEEEEERIERVSMRSSRRHAFEDIEIKEEKMEEEEAARVSICVPPKNALLLMRCRSDPMKMASLANRFSWDANAAAPRDDEDDEIEEGEFADTQDVKEETQERVDLLKSEVKDEIFEVEEAKEEEIPDQIVHIPEDFGKQTEIPDEEEANLVREEAQNEENERGGEEEKQICNEKVIQRTEVEEEELERGEAEEVENDALVEEEEVESNMSQFEALLDQETTELTEDNPILQDKGDESEDSSLGFSSPGEPETTGEAAAEEQVPEETERGEALQSIVEKEAQETSGDCEEKQMDKLQIPDPEIPENAQKTGNQQWRIEEPTKKEKESPVLPDCLLLMMCEPKLSMEVSKETWVCSTDFIRWLPERPQKSAKPTKSTNPDNEPVKKRLSTDSNPKPPVQRPQNSDSRNNHLQPPRSSCSLPAAAVSMATMLEHKLVNAVGYEPFVLTRCKSEPMRTAAAKLVPESCFWKNAMRKLEPHRRATCGVGTAGVGC